MVDRPIIFSGPMVRALIEGRKTQTRRILKRQPPTSVVGAIEESGRWMWLEPHASGRYKLLPAGAFDPRFAPGDRLWVKENFSTDFANHYPFDKVWYMADSDRRHEIEVIDGVRGIHSDESCEHVPFRWRPSIHMPRKFSRLTLIVEAVKVERLQAISEDDAKDESCAGRLGANPDFPDEWDPSPQEEFRDLWNSINGDGAWDANPWIVAVSFRTIRANIDAISATAYGDRVTIPASRIGLDGRKVMVTFRDTPEPCEP